MAMLWTCLSGAGLWAGIIGFVSATIYKRFGPTWLTVILLGIAACFTGDVIVYTIGRRIGSGLTTSRRFNRVLRSRHLLRARRLLKAQRHIFPRLWVGPCDNGVALPLENFLFEDFRDK
jgi:membrane protein DedA with SNARE-associated domain